MVFVNVYKATEMDYKVKKQVGFQNIINDDTDDESSVATTVVTTTVVGNK